MYTRVQTAPCVILAPIGAHEAEGRYCLLGWIVGMTVTLGKLANESDQEYYSYKDATGPPTLRPDQSSSLIQPPLGLCQVQSKNLLGLDEGSSPLTETWATCS